MLLIFRFSSGSVPSASPFYWQDFAFKKFGHILLFGGLAVFYYRALIGEGVNKKKAVIMAFFLSTLYGMSDEFHQSFIQGREARVRDVIIDAIGASIFGYFVYYLLPKMPKKIKMLGEYCGLI